MEYKNKKKITYSFFYKNDFYLKSYCNSIFSYELKNEYPLKKTYNFLFQLN